MPKECENKDITPETSASADGNHIEDVEGSTGHLSFSPSSDASQEPSKPGIGSRALKCLRKLKESFEGIAAVVGEPAADENEKVEEIGKGGKTKSNKTSRIAKVVARERPRRKPKRIRNHQAVRRGKLHRIANQRPRRPNPGRVRANQRKQVQVKATSSKVFRLKMPTRACF